MEPISLMASRAVVVLSKANRDISRASILALPPAVVGAAQNLEIERIRR
jgi:hypothetical protein